MLLDPEGPESAPEEHRQVVGGTTFALLARLAATVARPLDHPERLNAAGSDAGDRIRRIAEHETFRGPLNRAAASGIAGEDRKERLDPDLIVRLGRQSQSRLAVLVAVEAPQRIGQAALLVASAVLWRRFVGFALKFERETARAVVGTAAFDIATREAPVLHPALGDLEAFFPGAIFDRNAPAEPDAARSALVERGSALLRAFARTVEPGLAPFMPAADGDSEATPVPALSARHCEHLVKLLRRRMQPWAATIA